MTDPFAQQEIWFLTGSQHLYGPKALEQVAKNSSTLVEMLNKSGHLPIKLVFKPVLTTPEEIRATWLGRIFIRNLAMVFDPYLEKQRLAAKPLFSKTL